MTLEDIGNLGEAIGSLGLLITIVFLTIEMRWSRRESIRQQRQRLSKQPSIRIVFNGSQSTLIGAPLGRGHFGSAAAL